MATDLTADLEHQLLTLVRRSSRLHGVAVRGGAGLERSSYAILCLLHDEGPLRLGRIAQAFNLDPSTVTRQVQTVVRLGLARRTRDEADRRATTLGLTDLGRTTVVEVRDERRGGLGELLAEWDDTDRDAFLRLLRRFNTDADDWSRAAGTA